jgi:hypothetical protein
LREKTIGENDDEGRSGEEGRRRKEKREGIRTVTK